MSLSSCIAPGVMPDLQPDPPAALDAIIEDRLHRAQSGQPLPPSPCIPLSRLSDPLQQAIYQTILNAFAMAEQSGRSFHHRTVLRAVLETAGVTCPHEFTEVVLGQRVCAMCAALLAPAV